MVQRQKNRFRKQMWFGTQHHSEWVNAPLRGAEMSPEGWGEEGTYLSGGGFVRQSADSHRQYIFEWSGASSRQAAETIQAYRDGVYSRKRSDLIYFLDPLIYSRNILPKRWAQPGILTVEGAAEYTSLGAVTPVSTPPALMGSMGLPLVGAQVSSPFSSPTSFDSTSAPQTGSVWIPIPSGETLKLAAWTGNPTPSTSGLYFKSLGVDGEWGDAEKIDVFGATVSNSRGVLLGVVGLFDFYGARAVIGRGDDWNAPVQHEWVGSEDDSESIRETEDGSITNRFKNPDMVATAGEVVVWENLIPNPSFEYGTEGWSFAAGATGRRATGPNGRVSGSYSLELESLDGASTNNVQATTTVRNVPEGGFLSVRQSIRRGTTGVFQTVSVGVNWQTDTGAFISSEYGPYSSVYTGSNADPGARFETLFGPAPAGTARALIVYRFRDEGGASPVPAGALVHVDAVHVGAASTPEAASAATTSYFDGDTSFDSDLTPKWTGTPGDSTSQLVGTQVAGLPALRGVVVKSSQWSKSGGVSARFITTSEASGSQVPLVLVNAAGHPVGGVVVWRYQDAPIGEYEFAVPGATNLSIMSGGGEDVSAPAVNASGETLMSIIPDDVYPNGTTVFLPGGGNVGDSVWFDILTITDEPYNGPPFSGSSPNEGPKWIPGMGHSGCKFVGNPTWAANSGVNGGQIGYAATLKEVGDWQL